MGATIEVKCPKCGHATHIKFDPGPENDFPTLAIAELDDECPNHGGNSWVFMAKRLRDD